MRKSAPILLRRREEPKKPESLSGSELLKIAAAHFRKIGGEYKPLDAIPTANMPTKGTFFNKMIRLWDDLDTPVEATFGGIAKRTGLTMEQMKHIGTPWYRPDVRAWVIAERLERYAHCH